MRKKKIEAFVGWPDGTWTTELIAVDYEDEMDVCELEQSVTTAIIRKYLRQIVAGGKAVVFAGLYYIPDDDEPVPAESERQMDDYDPELLRPAAPTVGDNTACEPVRMVEAGYLLDAAHSFWHEDRGRAEELLDTFCIEWLKLRIGQLADIRAAEKEEAATGTCRACGRYRKGP